MNLEKTPWHELKGRKISVKAAGRILPGTVVDVAPRFAPWTAFLVKPEIKVDGKIELPPRWVSIKKVSDA